MLRRSLLTVARLSSVVLVLAAGACGDDDDGATATTGGPTTPAPATSAPPEETTAPPEDTTTTPPSNPDPRPAAEVVEIEVVGGEPAGGPVSASVPAGSTVSIQVTADVEDEVHLHGYDLTADVAPGVLGEITFVADIPGQFEIELEGSHVLIANLTVE